MRTGMTRRDLARASLGAFIISSAIGTMAIADDVKRISANGTELAYVEVGQGEPVIFVHGGLQDYRMWTEHLPKFAGRYRAAGDGSGTCIAAHAPVARSQVIGHRKRLAGKSLAQRRVLCRTIV